MDQGCQSLLATTYKKGKIYQITRKYTKWPSSLSNGCKIYQMDKNIPTSSIAKPSKI
jgi:hypothetical protein